MGRHNHRLDLIRLAAHSSSECYVDNFRRLIMIKKIDYIRNFGVFNNFSWIDENKQTLSNFSKRNLLYGWNYSGKTTISRIFSTLENNQIHNDFLGSSFRMTLDNNQRIESSSLENHGLSIRVFNTDFIEENLDWGGCLEPIIILGKDSIKHQKKLEDLEIKRSKNNELIESNNLRIREIENNISSSKTNIGREIKQTLDIVGTFNTRNVQNYIDQQGDRFKDFILPTEDYSKYLQIFRNNEKKDDIIFNDQIKDINIEKINNEIEELLNKTIIKKIKHNIDEDPNIYNWVKTGFNIHDGHRKCFFCNNDISEERWELLNIIFSQENDSLNKEIELYISSLKSLIPEVNLFNKLQLYKEFQEEYEKITKLVSEKIEIITKTISNIEDVLIQKKTKLYDSVSLENKFQIPTIITELSKISELVLKHNNKTKSFEKSKSAAKEKLINHYIGDFSNSNNFEVMQKDIEKLSKQIVDSNEKNRDLEEEIRKIQHLISEEVRGAQTINDYLTLYFGKDDILLQVNDEKKYQLIRQGRVANNLSEGEKTAISFSYFLARLHDKNTKLNETVLYIDDPISSLDSNHLYNTFALLKNKLRDCKQLFISTHNYEFFKLLRDDSFFKEYNKAQVKKASYYLIKRINKQTSEMIKLPLALKKYNSEYHFLFTTLLKLKDQEEIDDSHLFTVPNMSRKLLEIFTSFKIPNTNITLDQRLIKLCNSEQEAHRIYKFINHLSHSDSITFSIEFPTHHECKDILVLIFNMIERIDTQHYQGMNEIARRINNITIA
jgi:wobble nucleotide-excising tRNase